VEKTIADRIRRILREQNISERELARRSWLTESHIGLLLKKLDQEPGAIEWGTLRDIAWGARVDETWLASGRGEPGYVERPLDTVGRRFRARVEELALPVQSLDALMGLTRGYARALGRDQNAKAPDAQTAERICRVLRCSPGWLLTGKGERDYAAEETVEETLLRVATEHPEWGQKIRDAKARVRVSGEVIRFFADGGGGLKPDTTVDELVDAMLARQRQLNQEDEARVRREQGRSSQMTMNMNPPAPDPRRPVKGDGGKGKRRVGT
jgi:DNA-binding Xre family transcriptional regulator